MRVHRLFSPSQSERFTLCRGSVNLLKRTPPRPSSIYAQEGTDAHDVLEAGLRNRCKNATEALAASKHAGRVFKDKNEEIEFKASINDAMNYVYDKIEELELIWGVGSVEVHIETEVNPPLASAPGQGAGYCDIALICRAARLIYIIDYKHGAGIAKAVIGNTQVSQYACGFLFDEIGIVDPADFDVVRLVIIQPRAFHPDGDIREYDTTPAALWDYLQELDDIIADCLREDAPLTPGVEQCRFCDARSTCPAAEAMAVSVASQTFQSIRDVSAPRIPNAKQLDVYRLSYIAQMKPLLVGFLNAVDAEIEEQLRAGHDVPGFKLVEAKAKREWYSEDAKNPEADIARKLAALIGVPDYEVYRVMLPTITDAEAMVKEAYKARAKVGKKKQAAEDGAKAMAFLTLKKSSGNLTVAPADDERPAVNVADKSFGQVSGLLPPPSTI